MNTLNIVLMIILSAMIGFAIGNIWGKETAKRTLNSLLDQVIKGLKVSSGDGMKKKGE